jgi:hypothetical protein
MVLDIPGGEEQMAGSTLNPGTGVQNYNNDGPTNPVEASTKVATNWYGVKRRSNSSNDREGG